MQVEGELLLQQGLLLEQVTVHVVLEMHLTIKFQRAVTGTAQIVLR